MEPRLGFDSCCWPSTVGDKRWTCRADGPALKRTALVTVSGAAGWSLQLLRLRAALRLHLEEGPDAVLLRHGAAEVDDAALVRALVWRFDTWEAELVGDVAAGHFHYLMQRNNFHISYSSQYLMLFFFSNTATWQLIPDQTHTYFGGIFGWLLQGYDLQRNERDTSATKVSILSGRWYVQLPPCWSDCCVCVCVHG